MELPAPMHEMVSPSATLYIGGRRSGKSVLAERCAASSGLPVVYVATGVATDEEMSERIRLHRLRRNDACTTIEVPSALPQAITDSSRADRTLLIDCLTVWLTNIFYAGVTDVSSAIAALSHAMAQRRGPIVMVSAELGLGLIPASREMREFSDRNGEMNQALAAGCDSVYNCVAGIAVRLK